MTLVGGGRLSYSSPAATSEWNQTEKFGSNIGLKDLEIENKPNQNRTFRFLISQLSVTFKMIPCQLVKGAYSLGATC